MQKRGAVRSHRALASWLLSGHPGLRALVVSAALSTPACGGKTGLDPYGDAQRPHGSELPECDNNRELEVTTDATIVLRVRGMRPVASSWRLANQPASSAATLHLHSWDRVELRPEHVGKYGVVFDATATDGARMRCEYMVDAKRPSSLTCAGPEVVRVGMRSAFTVEDAASTIVTTRWSTEGPTSTEIEVHIASGAAFLTARRPGTYTAFVTAYDTRGPIGSCRVPFTAVTGPIIRCPASPLVASRNVPIVIPVSFSEPTQDLNVTWALAPGAPPGAHVNTTGETATQFVAEQIGVYEVVATATAANGETQQCSVRVTVDTIPTRAACPPTRQIRPMDETRLVAEVTGEQPIARESWMVREAAAGSGVSRRSMPGREMTFTPDVAGRYILEYLVVDRIGQSVSCTTEILALPREGLRVELYWNPPLRECARPMDPTCDDSDIDLHVLSPEASEWETPLDCYYANCNQVQNYVLDWGTPGVTTDNPRLDIDDVDGFGPENVNIDEPTAGIYRIGVVAFALNQSLAARAFVSVYCGESLAPVATFGPASLTRNGELWRVADVEIVPGSPCAVTTLETPAGPWVAPYSPQR